MVKMRINKNNEISLKKAMDKFIRHCKIKDLSESTIIYYNNCYDYFINFLKSELNYDDDLLINDIDKYLIENFILWLKKTYNMNNITINTRIRGIRALLYYFMKQNIIQEFKIDLLKEDKKIKKTYNDEELKRLLVKPDMDNSSFAEYRNWVIINFLLATAVRAKSLRNIKIKDIDLEDGVVFINTIKNRKQQVIPLSRSLITVLEEYLDYRNGEYDEYLFCTIYGGKMKSGTLNSAIRRYNKERDVNKTSVHLFRHTFAKKWILNGGDPFRLKKILGHSSMRVVNEYINMFAEDLKKDFNVFNPLEEFNKKKKHIKMK
mgnify:FL=1